MNGKPDCRTGITRRVLLAVALALFLQAPLSAQNQARLEVPQAALSTRLQSGVGLYGRGMWPEALAELRRAYLEGTNPSQKAEALYWIAMTELGAAHYEESVRAMDELQRLAPGNTRYAEVPYHRGRVYYYLGRFDEAIVLFRSFIDSIAVDVPGENARKPAALYWMGECLYSLGQLDRAQDIFSLIVEQYPQSVKYEASSYRLALINQKKIEVELLAILKWSHEESLKTVEEYQRRERSYDQAIIAYQRRIADLLRDDGTSRLEEVNAEYRRRLAEAEEQIALLERLLDETRSLPAPAEPPAEESTGLPPEVRPPTPAPLYSPMYPGGVSLDAGPAAAVPPAAISPAAPPEAATQAAQAPAAPPAPPPAPRQSPDQTERLRSIRASAVDLITGLDGELTGSGAAGEGY